MEFDIQKIETFSGHKDSIFTLSQGIEAGSFYSAGAEGLVISWNINTPNLGKPLMQIPSSIYSITKNNSELIVAGNGLGIYHLNILNNKALGNLKLNSKTIFDIKYHKNQCIVAADFGLIYAIDLSNYCIVKTLKFSTKSARCIAINGKKNEMAVGFSDDSIKIIDLETFDVKKNLIGHKKSVFTLIYSQDFSKLISGGRDAQLIAWDAANEYQIIQTVPAHLFAINKIVSLPKYNLLATGSMDKTIKIWDAATLKLLKVIDKARFGGHSSSINHIIWLEESERLVSAGDDKTISIWKLF